MNLLERIKLAFNIIGLRKSRSVNLSDAAAFRNTFPDFFTSSGHGNSVGYVAACAHVWGRSFAGTNFRLYDSSLNNAEVLKHPVIDIFKKPNPFNFTWWEYRYRIATDFIFEGNSYFLKLRDGLGIVRGLFQLHADRIQTYPFNSEKIDYYQYLTGPDVVKFNPEDIIHLRYPSRRSFVKGQSLVSEMQDIVDTELLRQQYHRQVYKKGGFYGSLWSTDQKLTKEQIDVLHELMQSKFGGVAGAYDVVIGHSGLQPVKGAYSLKEMQNNEGQAFNQKEISSHFGVNKLLLGESEQIQRGNADTIIYIFNSQVIDPLMDYIDSCLNMQWIQPDYDQDYFIKHDIQTQRDVEIDLKWNVEMSKAGLVLPSEIRKEEGYDEDLTLDDLWRERQSKPQPTIQPTN